MNRSALDRVHTCGSTCSFCQPSLSSNLGLAIASEYGVESPTEVLCYSGVTPEPWHQATSGQLSFVAHIRKWMVCQGKPKLGYHCPTMTMTHDRVRMFWLLKDGTCPPKRHSRVRDRAFALADTPADTTWSNRLHKSAFEPNNFTHCLLALIGRRRNIQV